jgi:hypothetical protein
MLLALASSLPSAAGKPTQPYRPTAAISMAPPQE